MTKGAYEQRGDIMCETYHQCAEKYRPTICVGDRDVVVNRTCVCVYHVCAKQALVIEEGSLTLHELSSSWLQTLADPRGQKDA